MVGVFFPPGALVVHQVLQAVPLFAADSGLIARLLCQRAPILVQPLESGQVSIYNSEQYASILRRPRNVVLLRPF